MIWLISTSLLIYHPYNTIKLNNCILIALFLISSHFLRFPALSSSSWRFYERIPFQKKTSKYIVNGGSPSSKCDKWRLEVIVVCIITERYLTILSHGLNKLLAFSTGEKSRSCAASHSLPFYLNASGLTSTRPHQTLQLCLQILLGDGKKNPILHREMVHFFLSFSYIIWDTAGTNHSERVR